MSTTERKARERRQRERALLDAAIALLDRDDWQAVTVEQIAERAEYAKGTIYRHFPSKDDLYVRLAADWMADTHAALAALDADRPFEALLREALAICWTRATVDRVHARLMRHVQRPDYLDGVAPDTRAALADADTRIGELLAGLVELGVEEDAIPPAPPEPRLYALSALLAGAITLGPPPAIDDPARILADAALAILRQPR
jgi:AcrR family transcriptional regulator